MRRGFAPFLALVLLFSCASARHSGPASTGDSCGVQGTWSGSFAIEGNGIGGPPRADTPDLRLVLMDSAAKVFSKEQGTWMEDKPGRFSLRCAGPNAVIAAIDSDRDSDGIWYESWVITLTVIDADRALHFDGDRLARVTAEARFLDLDLILPRHQIDKLVNARGIGGNVPAQMRIID